MKTIAYQGIEGSFSHKVLSELPCTRKGLPTFRAVYEAVEKGDVDGGLLPIENTLAGTIYETIDLLAQGDLHIVGELRIQVEHSLLTLPGAKEIRKVLSHPKALAQCTQLIKEKEWEAVPYYDTAGAAADVVKMGDPTLAAIASHTAAEIYGLEVRLQGIQDHKENYTRFFLISKTATTGKKASFCFSLEHKAGSLAERLAFFADQGVNLTYIVSRPIIGKPFEYLFYIDVEGVFPKIEKNSKLLGMYEAISYGRS